MVVMIRLLTSSRTYGSTDPAPGSSGTFGQSRSPDQIQIPTRQSLTDQAGLAGTPDDDPATQLEALAGESARPEADRDLRQTLPPAPDRPHSISKARAALRAGQPAAALARLDECATLAGTRPSRPGAPTHGNASGTLRRACNRSRTRIGLAA